jgi:hypothetical protein
LSCCPWRFRYPTRNRNTVPGAASPKEGILCQPRQNHVGFFGFGLECAIGILAENASSTHTAVTVENSYSAAGIVAGSLVTTVDGTLTVTIKGNQVFPDIAVRILWHLLIWGEWDSRIKLHFRPQVGRQ